MTSSDDDKRRHEIEANVLHTPSGEPPLGPTFHLCALRFDRDTVVSEINVQL